METILHTHEKHTKGVVLITGASNGIGRATLQRLIEDGHEVINFDISPPCELLKGESYTYVDLSNEQQLREALDKLTANRAVTRLVNNAGIVRPATIDRTTTADLHAVMAVNVAAAVLCIQALLPAMKAAGFGRIVNVSSRAALGKEERASYAASKAALHGLTKTLALELAGDGISVNAVGPGPIATELFQKVNPPDAASTISIKKAIPAKRLGSPAEVAHLVASLLDYRAGFTTGQVIYVCGGMTVGLAG